MSGIASIPQPALSTCLQAGVSPKQHQAALSRSPPLAGALVLEELEHARARGATVLAEFVGGAFTCDAHHLTEPLPDGSGVALCLQR